MKTIRSILTQIFALVLFAYLSTNATKCLAQEVPKVILPSPEAVTLFRFQTYPIDHSTGLPQINVPLYEIKSGSLSVPIGLSYHASGRRVYDQDGAIALGWTINAGGTISRTVNGSVDFGNYKFPFPFTTTNLSNSGSYAYFEQIKHYQNNSDESNVSTWKDSEYDIFSYYFGNSSGNFFFKDSNNVKTPTLLPYKPYIVTPVYSQTSLNGINILDDKGVFYQFQPTGSYVDNNALSVYNEFSLKQMISADKADTISFVYQSINQTRKTISQTITLIDKFEGSITSNPPYSLVEHENTNTDYYTLGRLTEIKFRQGKVVFDLVPNSDKINSIQIFNKNNVLIKSIQLNRSNLDAAAEISNYTSKLDAIVFRDNVGTNIETYSFQYYPTYNYNPTTTMNVRSNDWWGYYNGSFQPEMIPQYTNLEHITSANYSHEYSVGHFSANRSPNLAALTSGVLKQITYPTGGSSEFIYENNRYLHYSGNQVQNGPGLRIYQIKSNDKNGTQSYRTYTYGQDENGYGTIDLVPNLAHMATEAYTYYLPVSNDPNPFGFGTHSFRQRTFYSDFIPQLKELSSRPVHYSSVTEYLGTPTDNEGKTVYTYDYKGWAPSGIQVNRSLTIDRYHIYDYNYWDKPSLLSQKEYKNISNTGIPYQLKKSIGYAYDSNTTEYVYGLHVEPVNIFPQRGRVDDAILPNKFPEPWAVFRGGSPMDVPYSFGTYRIPVGYKNLSGSLQVNYNEDGTTDSISTNYTYNSRQYISLSEIKNSDRKSLNTEIKYPFDFSNNGVLTQMASPAVNMLNYPVEQNQFKNSTPISGTRTNYFNWGTTFPMIYPQTIETKTGTQPYETRVRFYGYDSRGNILSVSKESGPKDNYIWSYQKQFPIAKIENGDYNTIITLLGGTVLVNAFADRNPTDTDIKTFLAPLRVVDGAMKNSMVTTYTYKPFFGMTSSTDSKGMSSYYEYDNYQRLINVKDQNNNIVKKHNYNYSDGSITPSSLYYNSYLSGSYTKNDCSAGYGTSLTYRIPANKYSSSISQADADAKAQAELQTNGQNYANSKGSCYYKNVLKEQIFTRNTCEPGVNGSKVTYTVLAAKYISTISQADADAKALNEISMNGQAYANVNGSCGFRNVEVSKYFTRNNCPANTIPGIVSYKVLANTYYSKISQEDADAKAQAEMNANGQTYANNNASCAQPVTVTFNNSTSESFGISFSSGTDYYKSYVCAPGYSTLVLPGGLYTVDISVITSQNPYRMYIGSRSAIVGTFANFTNVNIANGSDSQVVNTIGMY